MTRQECEKAIFDKMVEIKKLYAAYHEKGGYLTLTIYKDSIMFNNSYYDDDHEFPVHVYVGAGSEEYESDYSRDVYVEEDDYIGDPETWAQEFVDSCEQFLSDDRVIREMEESDEAMAL